MVENVLANRVEAGRIAKENGGRLPRLCVLDNYINVQGNTGAFFAREFVLCIPAKPKDEKKALDDDDAPAKPAAPMLEIQKGRDFHCRASNILIPAKELSLFDQVVQGGVFGRHDFLAFLDPEAITFEKGVYVLQNPAVTAVAGAVTVFGGRGKHDPVTGVALKDEIKALDALADGEKRWNFVKEGVWPITQGIYHYFYYRPQREAQGFATMDTALKQVLVETIQ